MQCSNFYYNSFKITNDLLVHPDEKFTDLKNILVNFELVINSQVEFFKVDDFAIVRLFFIRYSDVINNPWF